MTVPSAKLQIDFLRNLQQLLDEGDFVATYKFALLMALADLSVERGDDSGDELSLPITAIAEKFIQYYWRQALPYPGAGKHEVLYQNTGRQAAVISALAAIHPRYRHSLARTRQDTVEWSRLVRHVAWTVESMPLWRLQTVGRKSNCFLYRHELVDGAIRLKPGVVYSFRQFHPMLIHMLQGAWAEDVRTLNKNQAILGQRKDLAEFLFGSQRELLTAYQPILRELQDGNCLYCGDKLRRSGAVDHFIPWVRYPVDLGHNFVLAHAACNQSKSDHLAGQEHLKAWVERNREQGNWLAEAFERTGLAHDVSTSYQIAQWSYRQAAASGSAAWLESVRFESVATEWDKLF